MRNQGRAAGIALALTGWSALTLQVLWQRVISLESGVDLASATTVVTAFLAGLGVGSLLGGYLADRLGPGGSRAALVMINVVLAAIAWVSVPVVVAASRQIAALDDPMIEFFALFLLLLAPTGLQGTLIPLMLRATTTDLAAAPTTGGRLTAWNTAGAVLGAVSAGWYMLGTFGFITTARIVATANVLAACVITSLATSVSQWGPRGESATPSDGQHARRARFGWYALYALTGAIALGYEQVFIRVVDIVMRSNSYSFAHVLSLYLAAWAGGTAIGARIVQRTARPGHWFFSLQLAIAVAATGALVGLTRFLPRTPVGRVLHTWFEGNGYTNGFDDINGPRQTALLIAFTVLVPAGLIAVPAALAGATLPFVQRLVSDEFDKVGRRFGTLTAANLAGSIIGAVVVSYIALDRLGSAGTYALLGTTGAVVGVIGVWRTNRWSGWIQRVGALLATVMLVLLPSNESLMATLHGTTGDLVLVEEDRSCVSVAKLEGTAAELNINGSTQNGYPFDDFHVLIGLLPAMTHADPHRGLAVGLGIGSTSFGMLLDPRLDTVETVELCGGNRTIIEKLATPSRPEFEHLTGDRRLAVLTADGRHHLAHDDGLYDVITVDTLRPQTANSGSFYSVEFFSLVREHLADDGVFATWVPTGRALNGVATVFPHVVAIRYDAYFGSVFVLAGSTPIDLRRARIQESFDQVDTAALRPQQHRSLRRFISEFEPVCITAGSPGRQADETLLNHDLHPRDEYFLNNPQVAVDLVSPSSC